MKNRKFSMQYARLLPLLVALNLTLGNAHAADQIFTLSIKDHQFVPVVLDVPAGIKFKLVVKNLDATPEEFESDSLHREKVIPGGTEAVIALGPLKPGTYPYKGEFHPKSALGTIVSK